MAAWILHLWHHLAISVRIVLGRGLFEMDPKFFSGNGVGFVYRVGSEKIFLEARLRVDSWLVETGIQYRSWPVILACHESAFFLGWFVLVLFISI